MYKLIQIYKLRADFEPILAMFKKTVPLLLSLFSYSDMALDVAQTMTYKMPTNIAFSHKKKPSGKTNS